MPIIKKHAVLPYTAEQMYELVDGITLYHEFVPWCRSSVELSRTAVEVRAELTFARGALHKSFSTKNHLSPGKSIEMHLLNGPFHYLEGVWRFDALDAGCRTSLDLDFEFKSRLWAKTFGSFFEPVANRLVDTFSQRAHQVYGHDAG